MANLPGLAPDDAPSILGRFSGGRAVTPDGVPDAPALRPVAAPVDTYSRPAMPDPENGLTRLAQSLSGFAPAMEKYLDVQAQADHKDLSGKIMAAEALQHER